MAEQAGGGPESRSSNPAVGRPGKPGLRSVRRPGARLATGTRAASGLRPGAIPPCQELADGAGLATADLAEVLARKVEPKPDHESPEPLRKAWPDAVVRTPQQSAERRAGSASWVRRLRRS